ncbi:MAG TPA: zf-HC2 domain-containing protein [Pyrinomonadaceae bacterium]|jgi:predicted anti-sigma-YlaC factor YlaD
MNNCEEILIQKWALLDGEETALSAAEIDAHLETCENCRREFEPVKTAVFSLQQQERKVETADLWSAIDERIAAQNQPPANWQPFILLALLLAVYKLVELLPARDLGWALKLVPLVVVVALFGFLKENPFKINTELLLENKYE